MSDFSKRITLEIGTAAAALAALAGGLIFFGNTIVATTDRIVAAREDLANWSALLQSYVAIRSQYAAQAEADITVLNNVLPLQDQLINLRKDFQFLAGGSNVSVNFSFTGDRTTASPRVGAIGVSLDLTGDFNSLMGFIHKLQSFHYLFSIDSVTFDQKDKTMTALLRGEVFFRK